MAPRRVRQKAAARVQVVRHVFGLVGTRNHAGDRFVRQQVFEEKLAPGGGVEFGGNSVSAPGYESYLTFIKPDTLAASLVAENSELKWADTSQPSRYQLPPRARAAPRCARPSSN